MELGCSTAEPLQMVKATRQHTHRTTVSLKLSLLFGGGKSFFGSDLRVWRWSQIRDD